MTESKSKVATGVGQMSSALLLSTIISSITEIARLTDGMFRKWSVRRLSLCESRSLAA